MTDPEGEDDEKRDALHPTHRNLAVFELCCAEIDKARDELRVIRNSLLVDTNSK